MPHQALPDLDGLEIGTSACREFDFDRSISANSIQNIIDLTVAYSPFRDISFRVQKERRLGRRIFFRPEKLLS